MSDTAYDRLQSRLHVALHGDDELGLSGLQRLSATLIVASIVVAILATEVEVVRRGGRLLHALEFAFLYAFVLEYAARVWAAGAVPEFRGVAGRLRYVRTPFALLDLLAIAPFLIGFGSQSLLLRLVRLLRLLALSRLLRYSAGLRLVIGSIIARRYELASAAGISFGVILLSAGALYTVEGTVQPEVFGSIPRAMWW